MPQHLEGAEEGSVSLELMLPSMAEAGPMSPSGTAVTVWAQIKRDVYGG